MAKISNDNLPEDIFKKASDYARRKHFRKNQPIIILEDDKLYLLDKNNVKTFIKDINKDDNI